MFHFEQFNYRGGTLAISLSIERNKKILGSQYDLRKNGTTIGATITFSQTVGATITSHLSAEKKK